VGVQEVSLLRVVVREDFGMSLAERLVNDIKATVEKLKRRPTKLINEVADAIAKTSHDGHKQKKRRVDDQLTDLIGSRPLHEVSPAPPQAAARDISPCGREQGVD
jgi:hypothetical protein